jgi:hypothetical protein
MSNPRDLQLQRKCGPHWLSQGFSPAGTRAAGKQAPVLGQLRAWVVHSTREAALRLCTPRLPFVHLVYTRVRSCCITDCLIVVHFSYAVCVIVALLISVHLS